MNVTKLFTRSSLFKTPMRRFSKSYELNMPIIDIDKFNNKSQGWESECKLLADCLHDTGIIVIKDRVSPIPLILILL
jgi:hypothetical protein